MLYKLILAKYYDKINISKVLWYMLTLANCMSEGPDRTGNIISFEGEKEGGQGLSV